MKCARPELHERLVELIGDERVRPGEVGREDPELRAHAVSCAVCGPELARLKEGWDALAPLDPAPPSEAVLTAARASVRSSGSARLAVAGTLGLGLCVAILCAIGILPAPGTLAIASTALLAAAYVLGLLAASGRRTAEVPFYGVTAIGLALGVLSAPGTGFAPAICLAFATAVALVPLALTGLALLRSGGRSLASGALLGAAAGTLGAAVWRLHCPAPGWQHALLFHATCVPLTAALGTLLALWGHHRRRNSAESEAA